MGRNEIVSADSLRVLHYQVQKSMQQIENLRRRMSAYINELSDSATIEVAIAGGAGISAASSTGVGSGTINGAELKPGATAISSLGTTETCYNIAGEVAPNANILIGRDCYGQPWVIVENCS